MLTQKQIKALKARSSRYFLAQDNLLLCVYPSGKKSFFYHFKCPKTHKYRRKKLGSFPKTSLNLAKKRKESLKFHLQRAFFASQKQVEFEQVKFEEEWLEFRKNVAKMYQNTANLSLKSLDVENLKRGNLEQGAGNLKCEDLKQNAGNLKREDLEQNANLEQKCKASRLEPKTAPQFDDFTPQGFNVPQLDDAAQFLNAQPQQAFEPRFIDYLQFLNSQQQMSLTPQTQLAPQFCNYPSNQANFAMTSQNTAHAKFSRKPLKNLTFKEVALRKMQGKKAEIKERTYLGLISILRRFAFKFYGAKAVREVSAQDLLKSFIYLRQRNNKESANKLFTLLGEIFRYAFMQELIAQNPMQSLSRKDLILKKPTKHFATLTHTKDIKALLNGVLQHKCELSTKVAIFMLALTAQRSINVRTCLWSEIDFKKGLWSIPAEKMKTQKMHAVALSSQVLLLLARFARGKCTPELFSSTKSKYNIISENTMRRAFRRLGYSGEEFVPHGFRAMFSTICHEHRREHKVSSDIIEQCLAHSEHNKVKASYNHASNLKDKARLMQWWGDYLDKIFDFKKNLDRIFEGAGDGNL